MTDKPYQKVHGGRWALKDETTNLLKISRPEGMSDTQKDVGWIHPLTTFNI